jgi:DmsE family decaheme c-type cytochrome
MRSILRFLAFVAFGFVAAYGVVAAKPQAAAPGGDTVKADDCKTCHESAFSTAFARSSHAGVEQSCESCHKGAVVHGKAQMEGDSSKPAPSVKGLKASEINATCLGCHEKGRQASWAGGMHDRRGVDCTSCHSVHSFTTKKSQLKAASASESCYSCHPALRAQALRTSHHPVREGLMECTSCHNPHDGSRPKMINADWANELCLQCHTEKRGPFLWEHAPVRENCLNCHNPHGSNHDKLLVAKQPYLCQRCHLNTRHPGTFYDGRVAGNPNPGVSPIGTASNRATEHACKNCHQYVHGGNAPSGPYLGR